MKTLYFQEAHAILIQSVDADNEILVYDSDAVFESDDDDDPSNTELLKRLVSGQIEQNRQARILNEQKLEQR